MDVFGHSQQSVRNGTGPLSSAGKEPLFFWSLEQLHTESITSARRGKRVMMS